MILQRLVLHNYGPYRGRHEIDLAPKNPRKPVILFGGMNGGGKTSLLHALQLCLFGRQASVWNSTEDNYEGYLAKCINRHVEPDEGAGIELLFTLSHQGLEQSISVNRYWNVKGQKLRESLDVIRDGALDTVLADNWAEHVEEILPSRVAPLFFFDGEKVEQLAKPEQSAGILRSAIHSLLGLDVVDQLQKDLEILERRKRKESEVELDGSSLRQEEQGLEADLDRCSMQIGTLTQELAGLQNESERLAKLLKLQEELLVAEGGTLFEGRHLLEKEKESLAAKIEALEAELRSICEGALPLALVSNLLEAMAADGERCAQDGDAVRFLSLLESRDASLLEHLGVTNAAGRTMDAVRIFLEEDRQRRRVRPAAEDAVLDARGLGRLQELRVTLLPGIVGSAQKLVNQIQSLEEALQGVERKLGGLPDEEKIRPMLAQRDALRSELEARNRDHDVKKELLRLAGQEEAQAKSKLDALRQKMAEELLGNEDVARTLKHSAKARNTLIRFRQRILATHVAKIERLALESFTALMRKKKLVRDIRIDPVSFAVTLQDETGRAVVPDRLSAGERQLLAVALLWGLCRASGRPIPTVIDTPLGRLDSKHRSNVVERYFPFASHQVILLSTDEEINERFLPALQPHISRIYLIEHEDATQSTHVSEGYFWRTPA